MKPFFLLFSLSFFPISTISVAEESSVLELEDLFVSAPLLQNDATTLLPVNILEGNELRLKSQGSIGEVLKHELGIHNASFGTGVGQPVIRGQTGSRVRVLQNGIGSLDVSALSPDHANSTEPLLSERIEVIRGAASLLYGSGAIGGIVNLIDNRIPSKLRFKTALEQRFNSASDETATVLSHDGYLGSFAWHFDGFYRQHDNVSIRGEAINETVEQTNTNTNGFIDNSDAETWSSTAGFSWIDDWGFIGFSANYLDNHYGIPPADEKVRVKLEQARYDMKAEIYEPFTFAKSLKLRLGINDYQHSEIEETGGIGTRFLNDAVEGRVELEHKSFALFDQGVIGFQGQSKQFSALGEEAFVPPAEIQSFAGFIVETMRFGDLSYQLGARIEQQTIETQNHNTTHTPVSASATALWDVTPESSVGLSFNFAQRAPDVQELFANGLHHATHSYEQGNAGLGVETAYNLELNFQFEYEFANLELNLFHSWNSDYIYQHDTGLVFSHEHEEEEHGHEDEHEGGVFQNQCPVGEECFNVLEARQQDARFYGFEAKVVVPAWENDFANVDVSLFGDFVRGKFDNGSNVPRQPPLRYGLQLDYEDNNQFAANLRFTRVEDQNRVGVNESPTKGYFLLSAGVNYELDLADDSKLFLFIKGENLLDENIRHSSSFLRNFAPEAGRAVELGFRIQL